MQNMPKTEYTREHTSRRIGNTSRGLNPFTLNLRLTCLMLAMASRSSMSPGDSSKLPCDETQHGHTQDHTMHVSPVPGRRQQKQAANASTMTPTMDARTIPTTGTGASFELLYSERCPYRSIGSKPNEIRSWPSCDPCGPVPQGPISSGSNAAVRTAEANVASVAKTNVVRADTARITRLNLKGKTNYSRSQIVLRSSALSAQGNRVENGQSIRSHVCFRHSSWKTNSTSNCNQPGSRPRREQSRKFNWWEKVAIWVQAPTIQWQLPINRIKLGRKAIWSQLASLHQRNTASEAWTRDGMWPDLFEGEGERAMAMNTE